MPEKFLFAGNDSTHQAAAVDMLGKCFDEWVDFAAVYGKKFPFLEESFVCYDENNSMLGHVGIMPFEIFDGKGGTLRCAGLASVGTAPEARNRGIANKLCSMAAEWAKAEGFDIMLLYTAAARVYEKSAWKKFVPDNIILQNPAPAAPQYAWKSSAELTDSEKAVIIECYNTSKPFSGKIKRSSDSKFFHSWQWMWQNPLARWQVNDSMYVLMIEDVIAEINGNPDPQTLQHLLGSASSAFLSPQDPAVKLLQQLSWSAAPSSETPACWHGEAAMYKPLNGNTLPLITAMPLADKF